MDLNRIKRGVVNKTMSYINERRGWTTERKIIVIESDDWGAIRMPNKEVYNKLIAQGYNLDQNKYFKYDTLASKEDFMFLYEVLSGHVDSNGRYPIITANTIVANPDFDKIRANNFKKYFYEPFTDTLKRYSNTSFDLWEEGINHKLFHPQLHGREHLNVSKWMQQLREGSKQVHLAFDNNFFGEIIENKNNLYAAFDKNKDDDTEDFGPIVNEASSLFQKIFKYKTKSFIAPNYYWDDNVEKTLVENDIKYIQGCYAQFSQGNTSTYHYTGEMNRKFGDLIYLKRNVYFEPSNLVKRDWVNDVLKEISYSFKLNKPAIICSHRVNFIGSLSEKNRDENLVMLNELLRQMLIKWPNLEFMTSDALGELIENDYKNIG